MCGTINTTWGAKQVGNACPLSYAIHVYPLYPSVYLSVSLLCPYMEISVSLALLYLYLKALYRDCALHSHTHSYTDGGGNHARHQPAHREQLGVQSLAQGLFDSNSGGARDQTGNPSGTLHVLMAATLPLSHAAPGNHGNHAKHQPAYRWQFRPSISLAQGHLKPGTF